MARLRNVLMPGPAGRGFDDFDVFFRGRPDDRVVGFTATQIEAGDLAAPPLSDRVAGRLVPE